MLIKCHGTAVLKVYGIHSLNMAAFSSDRCPSKLLQPVLPSALRSSSFSYAFMHATVSLSHLPHAWQHVFQLECDVDKALQSTDVGRLRLFRMLLGLQIAFVFHVVRGRWWVRFCYGYEIYTPKLSKSRRSRTWPEALDVCHGHAFISDPSCFWHSALNQAVAVGILNFGILPYRHSAQKCVRHSDGLPSAAWLVGKLSSSTSQQNLIQNRQLKINKKTNIYF